MGNIFYTVLIYPLVQLIEFVFGFCYRIFDNLTLSIIGVSLAVSLLTLPLYIVAEHWQKVERETQKRMEGKVRRIRQMFSGDERYMILSTYYRQCHYHPIMALRSSFGLLIQIPFFTAAYSCLSSLEILHGQPMYILHDRGRFIRDMGSPDGLLHLGILGGLTVNLFPLIMTAVNLVSGTIYTRGLKLREKIQVYALALVFVVILYGSPCGLVLYWTCNNIFSLVKNIFYKLRHPVRTLYVIACLAVTAFIPYLFISATIPVKRAVLTSCIASLVYAAPLFVRLSDWILNVVCPGLMSSFKRRLSLFTISSAGLWLLTGLLIPCLLIASSPMEFSGIDSYSSPMFFVRNTMVQSFGLFVVWPFLIFFLYKEKIQSLLSLCFSAAFLVALADAFLFHGSYGIMTKLLTFKTVANVDSPMPSILINMAVCLALFLVVLLAIWRGWHKILSYSLAFLSGALLCLSLVNIRKIGMGYAQYVEVSKNNNADIKEIAPIFHLSRTGRNVLVIYLDKAQNRYLLPVFDEYPALYEQFSGFTLYRNTVSFNGWTLIGASPCYGGYEYTPEAKNKRRDVSLVDKQNESILLLPRIFTEQLEGWSATITDPSWANFSWIADLGIFKDYPKIASYSTDGVYLDQWYKENKSVAGIDTTSKTLKRSLLWYSVFRSSPLFLRPAIYNGGGYWDPNSTDEDINAFLEGYSVLDYLKRLTAFDSDSDNTFTYFVNNTTHDGAFLQYPDYTPVSEITVPSPSKYADDYEYHSNAAALHRLGEFFDYLKENGAYDNTRIIIVADHSSAGVELDFEWDVKFDYIQPGHFHPLLMMKDFGSDGSLVVDGTFMTNADVPTLAMQGIVENPVNPFTGNIVDSSDKERGALVCTDHIFMPDDNKDRYVFTADPEKWWRVKDNIFKASNWTQEIQEAVK
ncbi:MAG: YidC/Oxa1 family membrane protein insertase [Treponema sp.]|nr:YidC/Oxa1 family membrane protein insertase [Treponema sp.]